MTGVVKVEKSKETGGTMFQNKHFQFITGFT
jgi:hypothetical protein